MFRKTYTPHCPKCGRRMKTTKNKKMIELLKNPISGKEKNYAVYYRTYTCKKCSEESYERIVMW